MWIITWKNYSLSKLATAISVIGALMRYAGVYCLFSGVVPAGIICFAIGIGIHFLAEEVAFDKWKKRIIDNNLCQYIINGDLSSSIQIYNTNPCEKALKYFEILNPSVANQIRMQINSKNNS